jgi:hypothetical protein
MCIAEQTMTLTLNLPPELEQYLLQEADQQHISIAPLAPKAIKVMTIQLLTQSALSRQKQTAAVAMLQSWIDDEDGEEQQETGHYLINTLDEDRLSDRKLFPMKLKGIS